MEVAVALARERSGRHREPVDIARDTLALGGAEDGGVVRRASNGAGR